MTYSEINEICKNYGYMLKSGERFKVMKDYTGIRLCIVKDVGAVHALLHVNSYTHALDTLRFIAKIEEINQ